TRSRSHQFLRALPVDAFARLFSQKHETAPAAAAEASFASPRRIDHVPEARDHISRLIIDAAISSQVARVMKYHAPLSRGIERKLVAEPGQQFRMVLDRNVPAVLLPIHANRAHAVRANRN